MSVLIKANLRGKSHAIAMWPFENATGPLKEVQANVQRSARLVESYGQALERIENDPRLSNEAKHEDRQKLATQQLGALDVAGTILNGLKDDAQERRQTLSAVAPYPAGDYSTVAIDLALAAHLRSMSDEARGRAVASDPRAIDAIVRLPASLTGLTDQQKSRISTQAIVSKNPLEAQQLSDMDQALGYATEAAAIARDIIATDAGLAWRPTGGVGTTSGDAGADSAGD
ncbi:hypothetical protein ACVWWQ_000118 [Rhodanobacter sp. TND4EL1]